jgi:hypothetical protein
MEFIKEEWRLCGTDLYLVEIWRDPLGQLFSVEV